MGREEPSAAARPLALHEPGQGVDHDFLGLANPVEQSHAVLVGFVLFLAAVAASMDVVILGVQRGIVIILSLPLSSSAGGWLLVQPGG